MGNTIRSAAVGPVLAFVVGVLVGIVRFFGTGWGSRACAIYVSLVRNTPLLVQIYFIYFGLPALGINHGTLNVDANLDGRTLNADGGVELRALGNADAGAIGSGEAPTTSNLPRALRPLNVAPIALALGAVASITSAPPTPRVRRHNRPIRHRGVCTRSSTL